MNIRSTCFLAFWLLATGFRQAAAIHTPHTDSLTCLRAKYVLSLKQYAAQKYWPAFGKKDLYSELQIRTKTALYVVNPFSSTRNEKEAIECPCEGLRMVRLPVRDTSFMIATGFHANSIIDVSDAEKTVRTIPVSSTEEWAVFVVHEAMHQFQGTFKRGILSRIIKHMSAVSQDSLGVLFQQNEFLRHSVHQENELLIKVLEVKTLTEEKAYMNEYLRLKAAHRRYMRRRWGRKFGEIEDTHEILESGTRFVEYHLLDDLKNRPAFAPLVGIDTLYSANQTPDIKQFTLENQGKYLWNVGRSYGYAIGFNSLRVLEKLKIPYQKRIYARRRFSFMREFEQWMNKN